MLLKNRDMIRQCESVIYANRSFLHLNLLPSGKLAASKFKSKIFILYYDGVWFASKLQTRKGNAEIPSSACKIALLDSEGFLIYRNEEEAEYVFKSLPLTGEGRFYCFVFVEGRIEIAIADRRQCPQWLRFSMSAVAGSCQFLAMSFISLIREFDAEAADGIEAFWFGKKQESGGPKPKEASDISKIREKS